MNVTFQTILRSGALLLLSGAPLFAQGTDAAAPATKPVVSDLAPPAHPATAEQIREYLAVTHADEGAHKMMAQSLDTMRKTANPVIPAVVWDEMGTELAKFDLITPIVPAFQKYLSQEDLTEAITFYRTPAGQRILASQPFIVSASQDQLRKMGQEIGQQVFERHKDEIEARSKELDAAAAARAGATSANPQIIVPAEGKKQ